MILLISTPASKTLLRYKSNLKCRRTQPSSLTLPCWNHSIQTVNSKEKQLERWN